MEGRGLQQVFTLTQIQKPWPSPWPVGQCGVWIFLSQMSGTLTSFEGTSLGTCYNSIQRWWRFEDSFLFCSAVLGVVLRSFLTSDRKKMFTGLITYLLHRMQWKELSNLESDVQMLRYRDSDDTSLNSRSAGKSLQRPHPRDTCRGPLLRASSPHLHHCKSRWIVQIPRGKAL